MIINLLTPHIFPKSLFELTKTYGTFLSSHNKGRWSNISRGYASAANIISSAIPLFRVFVASFAPFFILD